MTTALTPSGTLESWTDYEPWGMPMVGRMAIGSLTYRYGFQGQETDQIGGVRTPAFQLRLWDPRIGRWNTTDPYRQYWSPYVGMGNNPVNGGDADGGWFGGPGGMVPALDECGGILLDECGDMIMTMSEIAAVEIIANRTAAIMEAAHTGFAVAVVTDMALNLPVAALTGAKAKYEDPMSGDTPDFLRKAYWEGALAGHTIMGIQAGITADAAWGAAGTSAMASLAIVDAPATLTFAGEAAILAGYETSVTAIAAANAAQVTAELTRYRNQMNSGGGSGGNLDIPDGFKETKEFGYQHGQKVYEYKGKYYSRDVDSHNGGAWKVFEKVNGRLKRIGTADADLNIIGK